MNLKYKLLVFAGALGVTGAAVGGGLYLAYPVQVTTLAAMTRNYLLSWSVPPGTTTTESNAAYKAQTARSIIRVGTHGSFFIRTHPWFNWRYPLNVLGTPFL